MGNIFSLCFTWWWCWVGFPPVPSGPPVSLAWSESSSYGRRAAPGQRGASQETLASLLFWRAHNLPCMHGGGRNTCITCGWVCKLTTSSHHHTVMCKCLLWQWPQNCKWKDNNNFPHHHTITLWCANPYFGSIYIVTTELKGITEPEWTNPKFVSLLSLYLAWDICSQLYLLYSIKISCIEFIL